MLPKLKKPMQSNQNNRIISYANKKANDYCMCFYFWCYFIDGIDAGGVEWRRGEDLRVLEFTFWRFYNMIFRIIYLVLWNIENFVNLPIYIKMKINSFNMLCFVYAVTLCHKFQSKSTSSNHGFRGNIQILLLSITNMYVILYAIKCII